jgi:hypothetical protein
MMRLNTVWEIFRNGFIRRNIRARLSDLLTEAHRSKST